MCRDDGWQVVDGVILAIIIALSLRESQCLRKQPFVLSCWPVDDAINDLRQGRGEDGDIAVVWEPGSDVVQLDILAIRWSSGVEWLRVWVRHVLPICLRPVLVIICRFTSCGHLLSNCCFPSTQVLPAQLTATVKLSSSDVFGGPSTSR